MKLDKKDIEHIANLARLDLSEAETEKFQTQLSGILDYIEQLKEVDTNGIELTAQVTGLVNAWREDEVDNWPDHERQAAVNEAPCVEDGLVKVKRVL
jgi:aspartyl-tRNA(Asn)/glutamyl-tRNA(Gln) amidotransferase subunit C